MHLSASIGTGKAPMDAAGVRIALGRQGHNVLPQLSEALDPFGQTAPLKNADLDLRHIQPAGMDAAGNGPPGAARAAALPPAATPRRGWPRAASCRRPY